MWTGGVYDDNTGAWMWDFSGSKMVYSNWYPGEQNRWYDGSNDVYEHHVTIAYDRTGTTMWNDDHMTYAYYYVCEI